MILLALLFLAFSLAAGILCTAAVCWGAHMDSKQPRPDDPHETNRTL